MIPDLLWIIGSYAAAAVFAHWMIRKGKREHRRHYVLVAGNHQMLIEGYIRSLQHYSRRAGLDIGITVVLDESSDDTAKIMACFARNDSGIAWVSKEGGEGVAQRAVQVAGSLSGGALNGEQIVWVELAHGIDLSRITN